MIGYQDKINQILRGAETIKKNSMNPDTTPTPRTDQARHTAFCLHNCDYIAYIFMANHGETLEQELTQKNNEVARLRERLAKAEELMRGLQDDYKKARKAHLETCKNGQAEINKLHTENTCLQELIQEFYEWSRRDYPTDAEVREIMERYYNLLNHNPNNKPS
jgi:5-bromo-4-chloroindolyl phosphate hydrolysis protein